MGKREGLETEKGVESGRLGNKESKEGERGYEGKAMGVKRMRVQESDGVQKGRAVGSRG